MRNANGCTQGSVMVRHKPSASWHGQASNACWGWRRKHHVPRIHCHRKWPAWRGLPANGQRSLTTSEFCGSGGWGRLDDCPPVLEYAGVSTSTLMFRPLRA